MKIVYQVTGQSHNHFDMLAMTTLNIFVFSKLLGFVICICVAFSYKEKQRDYRRWVSTCHLNARSSLDMGSLQRHKHTSVSV